MNDTYTIPLPLSVREQAEHNTHPGLLLDKYAASWCDALNPDQLSEKVQLPTIREVVRLSQQPPSGLDFESLLKQRQFTIQATKAISIRATTIGPLTLHLSRASALENAGICMHHIYGFTYLPGTGIKGMVRAFAETVWLSTQPDQATAWQQIEDVFGWATNRDRIAQLENPNHPAARRTREFSPLVNRDGEPLEQREHSGRIVFHDAWPLVWPKLQMDILNSHHSAYYQGKGEQPPPGDWEDPIPVYFLSVVPGTRFQFSISARRSEDQKLIDLGLGWLVGALEQSGAGAKTNAGYGSFQIEDLTESVRNSTNVTWTANQARLQRSFPLTLATPAFLAGAETENPATCDLRVPTLRGQLRWWWRTLHAAHLSPTDLKRLESAIWGDTNRGGAVRVTLSRTATTPLQPKPFDRKSIIDLNHLPKPAANSKTTPGLTYFSFGMDEIRNGRPSRRPYIEPGNSWTVTFTMRSAKLVLREKEERKSEEFELLSVEQIAEQVYSAFELFCRMGGVGSKSRKGFGNVRLPTVFAQGTTTERIEVLQRQSKELRAKLRLKSGKSESPALERMLRVDAVATPWVNYWVALDRVGDSAQEFAQSKKHHLEKKALGLPRNVREPYIGSFRAGKDVRDRHASPIQIHLEPGANGCFVAELIAFPADRLPTAAQSQLFLTNALHEIRQNLISRTVKYAQLGQTAAVGSRAPVPSTPSPPSGPKLPTVGARVQAKLSSEKTKKGGWRATHGSLTGPIQNSPDVPSDKQPGDEVSLIVKVSKPTEIAFRWPTPADEASTKVEQKKKK